MKILNSLTYIREDRLQTEYKSVSFSITFRADDRTLVDDEVNAVMTDILKALEEKLGAVLRDK